MMPLRANVLLGLNRVIQKWSKDSSIERMHFQGLASMVRRRGGMRGLRASNKFLEQLLYWYVFVKDFFFDSTSRLGQWN